MRYAHTLVIGGTGMLRGASAALARRSDLLSSIARTRRSLEALDAALPEGSGEHRMVPLDWSDPVAFFEGVARHVRATRPPDLVVAWIHGRELPLRLVDSLERAPDARFFHVIGSATRNPAEVAREVGARREVGEGAHYRQVILGAHGSGAQARWLTDDEVSAGLMDAVARDQRRLLVGTLERWSPP